MPNFWKLYFRGTRRSVVHTNCRTQYFTNLSRLQEKKKRDRLQIALSQNCHFRNLQKTLLSVCGVMQFILRVNSAHKGLSINNSFWLNISISLTTTTARHARMCQSHANFDSLSSLFTFEQRLNLITNYISLEWIGLKHATQVRPTSWDLLLVPIHQMMVHVCQSQVHRVSPVQHYIVLQFTHFIKLAKSLFPPIFCSISQLNTQIEVGIRLKKANEIMLCMALRHYLTAHLCS